MKLNCHLPEYDGSYAILGDESQIDTAVLFVHGFNVLDGFRNAAVSTWVDFQNLTEELKLEFPWWGSCDLYFWSYFSAKDRILFSAQDLEKLISRIYPHPKPGLLRLGPNRSQVIAGLQLSAIDPGANRRYSKLLLVAHSEGAVVLRQAILNIFKSNSRRKVRAASAESSSMGDSRESVLKAEVRLFAPAFLGVSLTGIIGFLYEFSVPR